MQLGKSKLMEATSEGSDTDESRTFLDESKLRDPDGTVRLSISKVLLGLLTIVVTVVALTTAVVLKLSVVRCDELPASALPASTSRGLVSIGVVMSPSASRPGEDYLPASYVNWIQSAGLFAHNHRV